MKKKAKDSKLPAFLMKGKDKGDMYKKGGMPKFAKGGSIDGIASKGKTRCAYPKMK